MSTRKLLIFLVLSSLYATDSLAQPKTGAIAGCVWAKIEANSGTGLDGAVVEAIAGRDTLYTTTVNGVFQFKKVTAGHVVLRFSHLSYKSESREVEVKPGQTAEVDITLKEATNELETVTVRGEIPVLTINGDTLVYNAAAVRTLEGDETMKIVEQLPGVETSDAGVKVMGVDISRTYIDGKLIFGHDPMAALQNLLANDVLKIRVYDEQAEQNPRRKKRKGDETRRVFDIETKSKLIQATTGHFLASYGADLNEGGRDNRDRYGIGATANFFSESLLLSANAFFNNINRKTNRIGDVIAVQSPKSSYDRTTYVNAGMERSWDKGEFIPIYLRADYSFNDDYTRSENNTQQTYFPSSDYTTRMYCDTARSALTNRIHRADLMFGHPNVLFGEFHVEHHMRFSDNRTDSYRSYASVVDNRLPVGGQTKSTGQIKNYDISDRLRWDLSIFKVEGTFDLSNSDGQGYRVDSLTSTLTRRELRSSSDGLSRKMNAEIFRPVYFSDDYANFLEIRYGYTWEKSRRKQLSLDLADVGNPAIDTANTYRFTNNYNTHKAGIGLNLYFPGIKSRLNLKTDFASTGINRDEHFPENDCYDKRFNAFLPAVTLLSQGMVKRFSVQYMTATQLPSIEQLRPRIDDTNPYMLVAGNQHLRQSYTHVLLAAYSTLFGKANNNLIFQLDVKRTDHSIVPKRIFFPQETFLPRWNYTAPAQSTLTTYENVNGLWSAKADLKWIRPLRKLKSQLTVNAVLNYDDSPSFMDETLNRTRSYAPELNLSLRGNFSRSLRLTLGTRTSYVRSSNTVGQDDRYFRQGVSANGEWNNIFKRFYLNAAYSLSYYKRFGGNAYDLNNQILNVAVGCKVLKRRGDISFTAYDVLNRNSGFKTAMYSDYIQNSWTRSFGRYFTFNLAYRFNKSKSGVTRSDIRDGGTNDIPNLILRP